FESAFTYIYSPREGTPAAKMKDNVPMEVKRDRLQRLNAVVEEFSSAALKKYENQIVEVLVEGESKKRTDELAGYTRRNKIVNFKAREELIRKLVKVKITEARSDSLRGEFVEVVNRQEVEV